MFSTIPKFRPTKQETTAWQSQGAKVRKSCRKWILGPSLVHLNSILLFLTLRQTCFAGHTVVSFSRQSKHNVDQYTSNSMLLFSEILGNAKQNNCSMTVPCWFLLCYFAGTQEDIRCCQGTSTYSRQCEDWRPPPRSSIKIKGLRD